MIEQILDIGVRTAVVKRFSQGHLLRPESTMEHTGFVAMAAYMIGTKINEGKIDEIDMGVLLTKAIVHDLEESVIGDIINPTKHSSKEFSNSVDDLGLDAITSIAWSLDTPDLIDDWVSAKDKTTEGRIISFCDTLSVLMKLYEEVCLYGNKSLQPIATRTILVLQGMKQDPEYFLLKSFLKEAIKINKMVISYE